MADSTLPTHKTEMANVPPPTAFVAVRSLATLVPVIAALATFVSGLLSGNDMVTAALKALVALAATGVLSWIAVYLIAQMLLWLIAGSKRKEHEAEAEPVSTKTWEA